MTGFDWSAPLSEAQLTAWGVPAFRNVTAALGTVRQPHLDLSDLIDDVPARAAKPGATPLDTDLATALSRGAMLLYCDVLSVPRSVTLPCPMRIVARRVEIGPGVQIAVDHGTGSGHRLTLVTGEVVGADGAATTLPFVALEFDRETLTLTETPMVVALPEGAPVSHVDLQQTATARAVRPEDLDRAAGGPFEQLLEFQFQLGALLSDEAPEAAVALLDWVADAAQWHTPDIAVDAASLSAQVSRTRIEMRSAAVVPDFDHAVYRDSIVASKDYLVSKSRSLESVTLGAQIAEGWVDSAVARLTEGDDALRLADDFVATAKRARYDAQNARAAAVRVMGAAQRQTIEIQFRVEAGIELWRRKQERQATQDLIFGSVQLLMEVPVMAAGVPQVKEFAAMDAAADVLRQSANAAEAAFKDLPDFALPSPNPVDRTEVKIHIPDRNAFVDADLGDVELQEIQNRVPDLDDVPRPRLPVMRPGPPPPLPPRVDPLPDPVLVLTRGLPQESPQPANDAAARKLYDERSAAFDKARAAKRSKIRQNLNQKLNATNALLASANRARVNAQKVYASIETLVGLSERAQALEERSHAILLLSRNAYDDARPESLTGLGLVTGGAEAWETLLLDIENQFDIIGEALVGEIDGMRDFRLSLRKLVAAGRDHSRTQLAVIKATADEADANIRKRSAMGSADALRARLAEIEDKEAQAIHLVQLAHRKILQGKRQIYCALDSYGRALEYFTLAPESERPRLPSITAPLDVYERFARDISGQLMTVSVLRSPPQKIAGIELLFDSDAVLRDLRDKGSTSVAVETTHPRFADLARVRLEGLAVALEGLAVDAVVDVRLSTQGTYDDRMPDGAVRSFVGPRLMRTFQYVPKTGRVAVEARVADRLREAYFQPTPFTTWIIAVSRVDGVPLDLSGVTGLRLTLEGSAILIGA